MPDSTIKAVLFDLGDTLLNFGRFNAVSLFRQAARAAYDFLKQAGYPLGSFELFFWANMFRLRIRRLVCDLTGRDFDAFSLIRKAALKKKIQLNEQQWEHFLWLWYEPLTAVASLEPDTGRTLAALRDSGLALGLVSNTFVGRWFLDKHLEQLDLLHFFPVRLYSCEFDFRKPDVRIFRIAAERIGLPPHNILFVGDRIDLDIRPALKIGMVPVLKDAHTNDRKRAPAGVRRIGLLAELPDLIRKINARS